MWITLYTEDKQSGVVNRWMYTCLLSFTRSVHFVCVWKRSYKAILVEFVHVWIIKFLLKVIFPLIANNTKTFCNATLTLSRKLVISTINMTAYMESCCTYASNRVTNVAVCISFGSKNFLSKKSFLTIELNLLWNSFWQKAVKDISA